MELCQGGTLNDLLNSGAIKESDVVKILQHLLLGLEYLDNLSISHRDLKPENIFISSEFNEGQNETFYKIGDFGFAAQKQSFNEILGTYPFMAPEIYNR
jgi:serine/threonine protein kinase